MQNLKKATPYLLIAVFVGWFCYKFFVERKVAPEPKMTLDWDQLDSSSGSQALPVPASIKTGAKSNVREHTTLNKNEEAEFDVFDEMEKNWLASVSTIFGEDHFKQYKEMRDMNEKEKSIAYKEYHDYLRKKYGDKFTYNISEDQSAKEKDINQRYLKKLLKLVGEEKFQTYIKARDKINEDNRRNHKEFIQIEF